MHVKSNIKKFFVFMILTIVTAITVNNAHGSVDEETLLSALALNYCRNSLVKIQSYNDRIVLDEEYNNIINNIDLSKIRDEEIIELLEELMDTLSFYKLKEGDEKRLVAKYEKKVADAFYSSFSGVTNIIYVGGGNPYAMAAAAVTQIGGAYANYRNNLVEYREELDDELWKLEKEAIEQLNDIQKRFLRNSWLLMQKREIPDIWRLTDLQLSEYVDILKDEDVSRKLRKLERRTKYFEAYPPYWYYFGLTSLESNRKPEAIQSFNKFEDVHKGFFREDNVYISVLMNKVVLMDSGKDKVEVLDYLSKMVNESTRDWRKNLFAALKYAELEHYDEAKELLQINIDNKHQISLHMRLMGEIYITERDNQKFNSLINRMVSEDHVRSQDILYLLGKMPEVKKLNEMKDQIMGINIEIDKSWVGKDDINLFVPVRWIVEDFSKFTVELGIGKDTFNSKSFTANADKKGVIYNFEDIFELDKQFETNNSMDLNVMLNHPSGKMKILGIIEKRCEETDKNIIDKSIGKAKGWSNKILGSDKKEKKSDKKNVCTQVYVKNQIVTKASSYEISSNGSITKKSQ